MKKKKLLYIHHVNGNHWACIYVSGRAMHVIDSWKKKPSHRTRYVRELKEQFEAYKGELDVYIADSPKQHDNCSCGVFACLAALHILTNKKLTYSQKSIPKARLKITADIIRHGYH